MCGDIPSVSSVGGQFIGPNLGFDARPLSSDISRENYSSSICRSAVKASVDAAQTEAVAEV
jgi:hypothetical protein